MHQLTALDETLKKITYSFFFFFFGITIQETSEGLKSESQEHTLR